MKKKIISLLLVTMISSAALISCGKTKSTENSYTQTTTTEQTSGDESTPNNSSIVGENNKPTVQVSQIATISAFKDKDKIEIEKLLGKPINEKDNTIAYEKDNYTFEITYLNSKCNEIKIIPKAEMKYPADGVNILKLVGINAGDADIISPGGLEWNNKFNTSKINVVSNNELDGKISYVAIIL